MDSGIGYTQDLYRPAHAQLVGRKRRADDDSLLIPNAEVPDSAGRIPWDGPHMISCSTRNMRMYMLLDIRMFHAPPLHL